MCGIGIPYFGKPSHKFAKRLSTLFKAKFQIDLSFYNTSFKTGSYFNLKCLTPHVLLSNVVYKFSCLRDAIMSCIGMTTRHLGIRANQHLSLQLNSKRTAVKDHILTSEKCKSESLTVNDLLTWNEIEPKWRNLVFKYYLKLASHGLSPKNVVLSVHAQVPPPSVDIQSRVERATRLKHFSTTQSKDAPCISCHNIPARLWKLH